MLQNPDINTKMISGYPKYVNGRWVELHKFEIWADYKGHKECAFSSFDVGIEKDRNRLGFQTQEEAMAAGRVKLDGIVNTNSEGYIPINHEG